MNPIRIALIQMSVGKQKAENIKHAIRKIIEAKEKGSSLVVLPECFNSPYGTSYFNEFAEEIPDGETCQALSKAARDNKLFLVGGSIPEREGSKLYNTCTVWNPHGTFIGKFRKLHLFDIHIPGSIKFKESDVLSPGNGLSVIDIGSCKIGLGICYDVRFNEMATLYRDKDVDILLYPGAFNMKTGPLHWELLLRARAVDNQMYVAGVCCARDEASHYVAWGHTMLVDPWGKIVTQAESEETILYADIDLKTCQDFRQQVPIREQRRADIYNTTSKI